MCHVIHNIFHVIDMFIDVTEPRFRQLGVMMFPISKGAMSGIRARAVHEQGVGDIETLRYWVQDNSL